MNTFLGREPVLAFAVVQAVLLAVSAFGLDLSGEQVAAVEGVALAVLSFLVRSKVTPV